MTIPRSLWDCGMVTDVQGQKCVWKKNEKNLVYETMVWSLADRVKNLIEKKWPGLSDSDMITGGLIIIIKAHGTMGKKYFFEPSFIKIRWIVLERLWNIKMLESQKEQAECNTLLC